MPPNVGASVSIIYNSPHSLHSVERASACACSKYCRIAQKTASRLSTSTMADRKAVIVGISGASSSGKTTLARLLRDIFPNTFILHEDDFYKEEKEYVSALKY